MSASFNGWILTRAKGRPPVFTGPQRLAEFLERNARILGNCGYSQNHELKTRLATRRYAGIAEYLRKSTNLRRR